MVLYVYYYVFGPPRCRRGNRLDCGSRDLDLIPGIHSLHADSLTAREKKTSYPQKLFLLPKFYFFKLMWTCQCFVFLSRMFHDILEYDHMQWHPLLIRNCTNSWRCFRTGPYLIDFGLKLASRHVYLRHIF